MRTKLFQHRSLFLVLLSLTAILLRSPKANAQVLYGSIVGVVTDTTGASVPSAAIVIANPSTGFLRQTTSTQQGEYSVTDLPPGQYSVTVSASGLRSTKIENMAVSANVVSRGDAQLEVGSQTETVTVSGDIAKLQTDSSDVHTSLGVKEITQMPLPGYRNYQTLLNLVPGSTPATYQNAVSGSPARSLASNINGTNNGANNTRLDGALNMRGSLPAQSLYVPPVESIETVNISTASFDAEQGFAGGAAINVITKSGTNEFHGVLFAFHTDNDLKARNFFATSASSKDILNTYGGAVGGPIRKNKLYFFTSWEGVRERSTYSKITTVPTDSQKAGIFTGLSTIYDPMTGSANGKGRTPFVNNVIPADRISAVAMKMNALLPEPNLPGTTSNYFDSAPVTFNRDNIDAKVNWTISEKSSFWGKYSAMDALTTDEFSLGAAGGSGMINGGGAGTGAVLMQVAALGGVHIFSPTFLMDGNMAFSRDPLTLTAPDFGNNFGLNGLGIPGTNGTDPRYGGIPEFSIAGYETFGNAESYSPKYIRNTYFTYSLNFGWTKGTHEMRFGADIGRYRVNEWHPELGGGPRGAFTFDGSITALNGGASPNQFNNYAAYLLGLPQTVAKSAEMDYTTPRQWMEGYYFRDRWQVTPKLTLNLGLRWEYYPLMTTAHTGIQYYNPTTNMLSVGGLGSVPEDAGISVSHKLFAPRFGLAYQIDKKTVVRSGFGISIDPTPFSTGSGFLLPYPVVINQSFGGVSYVPYGPILNGIPSITFPNLSTGIVPMPLQTTTTTLPNGFFKRGYIESYNFVVQREFPQGFVGSVGYVGTRTINQVVDLNINAAPPLGGNVGRPLAIAFGRTADTLLYDPMATASYNSLQAELNRRLSSGLLIKMSYTYSRAIDLSDTEGGTLLFNDPADVARNKAVAGYDRTNDFRLGFLANLPFGPNQHWLQDPGIVRTILGGWQVNGIFSAYSGTPFTVTASGASLNAPGETQTADQVKASVAQLGGIGPGTPYYDPTAFAAVTSSRYGTSGRDILRGPGLVNLDASLFRNFAIKERLNLQFRAEAYNISNTPHFNNPNANVSAGGFLTITSALDRSNNVEGGERQLRFALRVSF